MMRASSRGKPRLLVIVNYFPPDEAGGARVFGDMCYRLAELDFDVTVRCAYPFYPEWRDKSGRNGWRVWRYEENGIKVEHFGLFIPRNPNSLVQRLVHEASLFLSYVRSVPRSRNFDIVMAYCPTISTAAIGALIRLLYRKPLWLNVQDLAAEAASGVGLVKSGPLLRAFLGFQRWLFNRATIWSTIEPLMAAKLEPHRRRGQPLLLIPNWLDQTIAAEIARQYADTGRSSPRTPVRLLYSGNIGMKQGLLELLQALQRSPAPFEFRIHGAGAQSDTIQQWLAEVQDPRFSIRPLLDPPDFAHALLESDYFVITQRNEAGASFMPSKLIVGLTAGIPALTVCAPDTPLGSEVLESDVGPSFSWDQLTDVVDFVVKDAREPDRHRAWSQNALRRAKEFDRDALVAQFATELHKALDG